jgi:hypothetical protein
MSEWNRRLSQVLKKRSVVEVGLLAARDVQAALDYEKRLLDFENWLKEKEKCS